MKDIKIIALIVAKALPVLNTQITSSQFSRITTISLADAKQKAKEIIVILFVILNLLYIVHSLLNITLPKGGVFIDFPSDMIINMASNSSNVPVPPSDPVRWWPSGVPQSASVVAAGVGTFAALTKLGAMTPKGRVFSALTAAGVSATTLTYNTMLENSVGFNRLMWGFSEYNKTGQWPSVDLAYTKGAAELKAFESAQLASITSAQQATIDATVKGAAASSSSTSTSTNAFLPSSDSASESLIKLFETLFREIMQILQPVSGAPVQGYFDDLVGQRMFIEFILFFMCLLVILSFVIFILNLIFLSYKGPAG